MRKLPAHLSHANTRRGQALLEFALILPVLLLLVAGALDLGRAFYGQITITNAAREGALEAARNPDSYDAGQPCADDNRVVCRAVREAEDSFITVAATDVTMTCDAACSEGTVAAPNTVSVKVVGQFSLITPLIGAIVGQDISLSSTATATIAMTPTIGAIPIVTPSPSPTPPSTPSPSPLPSGVTPSPTPSATLPPTPEPCSVPTASFTVSPSAGVKNKTTFVFTDTSTNVGGAHCNPVWAWSFGDGGHSGDQNTAHLYDKRDTYTVQLVVSNSAGSSAVYEVDVVVTNN